MASPPHSHLNNNNNTDRVTSLTIKDPAPDSADEAAPSELVQVVDDLLVQFSTKFSAISSDLLAKIDEMSRRLDVLEATIQHAGAGAEGAGSVGGGDAL